MVSLISAIQCFPAHKKKTPPEYGESLYRALASAEHTRPGRTNSPIFASLTGPMMVACHWKRLSPIGPAEHELGGSRPRSSNSCMRGRLVTLSFQAKEGVA
jgi:hypothetical protein